MHSYRIPAAARTARRWVKGRTTHSAGEATTIALDIGQLISPLRFDVLIRAKLFETWAKDWSRLKSRPDEALQVAQNHAYRTWFDSIARRKITGKGEPSSPDEAFEWRVKRSHRLLGGYIQNGFDQRRPITVKLHLGGELPNGKVMGPRLYPVDGCHRLALLWADGERMLDPALYRLLPDESATRDNTTLLLEKLQLSEADYYTFIGWGYGVNAVSTESELVASLSKNDPRTPELLSVLAADHQIATSQTTVEGA